MHVTENISEHLLCTHSVQASHAGNRELSSYCLSHNPSAAEEGEAEVTVKGAKNNLKQGINSELC